VKKKLKGSFIAFSHAPEAHPSASKSVDSMKGIALVTGQTRTSAPHQMLFGGWVNYNFPVFAFAFAFSPDSVVVSQGHVNNSPLAGIHGVQPERQFCLLDLRGRCLGN
jgi:hypothetical protein